MKNECWVCGAKATKRFDIYDKNKLEAKRKREFGANAEVRRDCLKIGIEPSFGQRAYCDSCFDIAVTERKLLEESMRQAKMAIMVEKAIRMFEQQGGDVYEWRSAINTVSTYASKFPEKFASSHEVLAAIVLSHSKVKIRPQYQIAGYIVDFCLPEMKVMLEIDGERHKANKDQDALRDFAIMRRLGKEWSIVRIPTECIEMKASRLLEAINVVLAKRAKANK
jgi:very-short-patch-repair endonuclease